LKSSGPGPEQIKGFTFAHKLGEVGRAQRIEHRIPLNSANARVTTPASIILSARVRSATDYTPACHSSISFLKVAAADRPYS
jgi:hypothetical protein